MKINSRQVDYDSLIIDCTAELREFRGAVSDLYMPVIELPALLDHILPSLINRSGFNTKIDFLANNCGEAEGVFMGLHEDDEDGVYEGLAKAIIQFGNAMKNKLESYNAYRAGVFAYELKEYVNDATVVFTKRSITSA